MKFSVIMPCRNAGATLAPSIESVFQSGQNVELIVVDGASTDSTAEVVARLQQRYAFHFISEPDEGIYHAINKGLRRVTGDVVAILNANDAYTPQALPTVAAAFQDPSIQVVYGSVCLVNPCTQQRIEVHPLPFPLWFTQGLQQLPVPHVALFIRKGLCEQLGAYHTRYSLAADHEYVLRLAQQNPQVLEVPHILAYALMGGVGSGYQARYQSALVAIQYGRSRWYAGWIFLLQTLKVWIFYHAPQAWVQKLRGFSRFKMQKNRG